MSGRKRRIARARRCARERFWKSQESPTLEISTPMSGKGKGIPLKGNLKADLRGAKNSRRQEQYTGHIEMPAPGVKIRGKIGPSGHKSYKCWIRKDEL